MTGAVFAIKVPLGLYREPGMRFYNPKSLKIPTISAVMGMLLGIAGVGAEAMVWIIWRETNL